MKLKKIASLLLAGVMCVSMLAGCSSSDGDDDGVVVTPSEETTYSSEFYSYLDYGVRKLVTAEEDNNLADYLATGITAYKADYVLSPFASNKVLNVTKEQSDLSGTTFTESVVAYLHNVYNTSYTIYNAVQTASSGDAGEEFIGINLYAMSGAYTDSYVLKQVAGEITQSTFSFDEKVDYTISVGLVDVTGSTGLAVTFVAVKVVATVPGA